MRIIFAWVLIGSAQAIRRTVQLEEVHTISKGTADAAPSHLRSNHQRRELSFWSSFMSSVKCLTNAETRKEYNCHTHKPKAHAGGGGGGGAGGGGGGGGDAANGNGSSSGNDANGNNTGDQSNGRNGSSTGTSDGSTNFNLSSSWTLENGNTYTHNQSDATCTVKNGGVTCTFENSDLWNVGNGNNNGGDVNNGNNNGGNGDNNGDSDFNACNGCTTYTLNNNNNNNNNNGGAGDDGSSDDTCTYLEGTGVSCTDGFYYGFDLYNLADAAPTPSPTFQNSISNDSPEITAKEGISRISPNQLYGALTISGVAVIAALLARKRRQDVDLNDEHLLNGAVGKRQKVFGKVFSKNTLEETPGATHYVKA